MTARGGTSGPIGQPTAEHALRLLEPLVGDWTVEATWPNGEVWPGGGRVSFEWHASGAHLLERGSAALPEAPDNVSVIGCDGANGTYFQLYTDERGVCRVYEMRIGNGEWTLWREGEPFSQRFCATFSEDGNTITGRWEIAEDGADFRTDFDLVYTRVEPEVVHRPAGAGVDLRLYDIRHRVLATVGRISDRATWQAAFDAAPTRPARFTTMSGLPLEPVYGPPEAELPGQYPFTRGAHASMYRSKLWTMRQFAGFGTAVDTNRRFKHLLASGGDGLSTAFDMPTLLGRDPDESMSLGEVGRAGVAVDTVEDMATLFDGIDLGSVTTSMTINSAAATVFAMYVNVADDAGTPRSRLGGTIQNDILKEYQAQKEYIFPPRPSMRLTTDLLRFSAAEVPRWNPISVSGYHIREAGSTALQELAFTLANGFAYVEAAVQAGLAVDAVAPRMSFFFNAHIDFFEELAKYHAARRIWARWLRERYGAVDDRSLRLRFHTQTAGVSLTAQQPEVNIARVALEALAAVLGGTQSLHTDAFDEALALPTEEAARIALRTQQVIAHETNVAHVADPLGGSWYVEALTDDLERRAEEVFAHLDDLGGGSMLEGVYAAIEEGWFQSEIADAAYEYQRALRTGDVTLVGVTAFTDGDGAEPSTLRVDPVVEVRQLESLASVKQARDDEAVRGALAALARDAEDPAANLLPDLLACSRARVTVGEVTAGLEAVFGSWVEPSTV